jgi:hypothetical protein
MEAFFRSDFRDVRVHVGAQAQALGATAFTHGSHIHFAPGQYDPHTQLGQQILGRELAHVVQQRAGRVRNPFGNDVAVVHDHALEAEATRMGAQVAQPTILGGLKGAGVGGIVGGVMGSFIPVVGTSIGGTVGALVGGFIGGYVLDSSHKAYASLPQRTAPVINGSTLRLPRGTSLFHGTRWQEGEQEWWRTSTPGRKNDEDGGVSYTLVPETSPKVRNAHVILEYKLTRDVDVTVCKSKADFGRNLKSQDDVCYTPAEQEVKIRVQDGSRLLTFSAAYDGNPKARFNPAYDIV